MPELGGHFQNHAQTLRRLVLSFFRLSFSFFFLLLSFSRTRFLLKRVSSSMALEFITMDFAISATSVCQSSATSSA